MNITMSKTQILDSSDIRQKTTRIAYQIVEDNADVREVYLIGVVPNGFKYAKQLQSQIEQISDIKVELFELAINKNEPHLHPVSLDLGKRTLDNKVVILVDDVANTGKTMYYALKPLLAFAPAKVQSVVLVDRQHKLFPITPDFVGLSLSTTLREHIKVEFSKTGEGVAYLI